MSGTRIAALAGAIALAASAAHAAPAGEVTVAAVGDMTYLRPALATIERTAPALVQLIRGADVAFGNFETSSFELKGFTGSPQIRSAGPIVLAWPGAPKELKAMGFDIISHANNHTFDFGSEGALATDRTLSAAGLVHAGAGPTLKAARAPHSFASGKGSVGLAAATSTFQAAAPASDAYGPIPAHPGVNALRTTRVIKLDPEGLEALRKLAAASPGNTEDIGGAPGNGVRFQGLNFDAAPRGAGVSYAFQMNPADEAEIIDSVKAGKTANRLMLFSLHTHEPVTDMLEPADFTVNLAHEVIDAGANGFLGHGAHQLRGIEIYKGKPIFYSLGNFAVMLPTPGLNPGGFPLKVENGKVVATTAVGGRPGTESLFTQRAYFESVIAVMRYAGDKLVEVRLHPFELAVTGDPATHGLPRPVSAEAGRVIIMRLQALSKPFGTVIAMDGDVGVIRVN